MTAGTAAGRAVGAGSLALGAVGVVFGDIGTSPLYAFRESIGHASGDISDAAIGTASLAIWAVTLVVTVKYLLFVMRADNHGEGGILALLALLGRWLNRDNKARFGTSRRRTAIMIGLLIGASLLLGDGALTPAISVLSAVEGVGTVSPTLGDYAVPIAVVILVLLFAVQSKGTGSIGRVFGPVMVLWFLTIAGLGTYRLIQSPGVLKAFNPTYAVDYLFSEGLGAFTLLSFIILTVTGAEALYADMGHFGLLPIRLSWFALVKPALLLCYLGQAAFVTKHPDQAANAFYGMSPNNAITLALVVLATLATVIASQALITGAFSLVRQAVQLRLVPRLTIRHTSVEHEGQIYIPLVNYAIGVVCVILTVSFGSSSALASAYVFAVAGTMLLTSIGFCAVAHALWKWSLARLLPVAVLFFVVDISFFVATATKIVDGGYVPVVLAGVLVAIMVIWRTGQHILHGTVRANDPPWDQTVTRLKDATRMPVFGVFLNSDADRPPQALLTELSLARSVPQVVLSVTVETQPVPFVVDDADKVVAENLAPDVWRILVRAGYSEATDLPAVLAGNARGIHYPWPEDDGERIVYFLNENTFRDTPEDGGYMSKRPEAIYNVLQRNAASPTTFYSLPPRQIVTIGTHIDL
ncbi:MAG: system potassium uptake protein [Frankiaceae bacterium]|jgi:KUP system potassium uptake protein|nr:system potassium uptake protein [Frankiaceae bacterium]